ncbi:DUF1206 domain-containing protein [Actinomycetospora lemnae]|uniref:DUF1206 domain-containing protein n=1 Tax=Actinomycetospora lemnae TaxID=3019891 RepID=A0ABT5T252_9PSEU|nr:DUF1206 domain-containing protein [Actinomycetospora sp. DW7H6]MDD7969193.1 DUF1206 domain-containing protein [Actinomycetospora sp. DW7H6]
MTAAAGSPDSTDPRGSGGTADRFRDSVQGDGEGEAPHRAVELLGRVGLAGYGLVHLLIGVIAVQIAMRGGGQADQQGAVATLAAEPFGFVVLIVIVVGLVAFGIWQGLAAATGFRWATGWARTQRRIAAGATAVGVLFVALVGVQLLVTGSSGSSSGGSQQTTAGLLALPGGRFIVFGIALVVLVIAGATAWTGIRGSFAEDLAWSRLPSGLQQPVYWLGIAGHVLRAIAFAVMAVLFGVAAVRADPGQAGGLDAALKTLAAQPFGPWLLVLVALGFVAYGLYCGADAWARRI